MPDAEPAAQRAALGRLCAVFGGVELLATAYILLSSGGPAPVNITARSWSAFYFTHFVALTVLGYGIMLWRSAKSKLFHGGPMIDFTIAMGGLVVASSFGRAWIPGLYLLGFGLRLLTGRPLLAR